MKQKSKLAPGEESHRIILEEVVKRLHNKKNYSHIFSNLEYSVSINEELICGEVDVLCFDDRTNQWVFYEIKSNPYGSKRKAQKQYKRFKEIYTNTPTRGFLVYPDFYLGQDYLRIKRL
jgi:hypothetical protein